ncbi:MAG: hypothetical protein K9M54_00955 [Kiritimatiellales bacterium]|nr:hypothetical protein [Kiritimatiellales bacterium]
MKSYLLTLLTLLGSTICRAEEIPLSKEWKLPGGTTGSSPTIALNPTQCSGATMATQQIKGPFAAGELLRFSADVEISGVKDDKGKDALRPFDLNMNPRNVCLAVAQLDDKGRTLSACGSARLLGTEKTRLMLEVPVQQDVALIELRLLATLVTGDIHYRNMVFEKLPAAPLQDVPEAKIMTNSTGRCFWQIDGKTRPLVMYFGNNQFNHDDRILEEMEKATAVGVPVLSFNLYLPSMVSNSEQLKMIERFMKPFPNAYFIPRIWLGPGAAYQQSFPEEMMKYADGRTGGYASASSEHWKNFTDNNLRELVKLIRRSPYARQFAGLKLTYYQTGEWIYWDPQLSAGYDEPTRLGFIQWLKNKYGADQDFSNVQVPTEAALNTGTFGEFRDPKTQQQEIDFSLFYNTINADNIIRFARTVKEATDNRSLTATFYGYLFELAWDESWPQQAGHLGLEKLYRSPYIDIIGAPYSYSPIGRGFGLPVDLHGPFDGIDRYGKVAMIEEDTFTHLALDPKVGDGWEAQYAPGYASRTTNMEETLAVLRRDLGVAATHNQLMVWQNLFSEGRFNDQKIWDMYKPYLDWMQQRAETAPPFQPQVAVVASADNMALLKTKAYGITERWLYQNRFSLNRVDTSIGYYLQSDLATLPDSVRCVILLNPYRITANEKSVLAERFMRDGKMIIFCYMPNVYDDTGFNPNGTAFCGIDLELNTTSLFPESKTENGTAFGGRQFGRQKKQPVEISLSVKDRNAEPLAHYSSTRDVSCALKEMQGWTSVYLGSSGLPPALWRTLFQKAGCHLFFESCSTDFDKPDFVQANGDFLMVQSATGGRKTIRLPQKVGRVYRFDTARPKLVATDCNSFQAELEPGIPAFFVCR